ncbi:unnamed protein product (mitochondrion) [Plasmodiophora brassicae]|uniref:Uncharacterized protein n=1 Tax=Plasmodiophora brassicae TaxID=37360 RepID=A0A0G4IXK7_PLABS|nr:hypothetical protein PBRA_007817 [Plasmodiophora brassicae]SPR00206.1 unnamed protein product [Plasmodiophora brassicae]
MSPGSPASCGAVPPVILILTVMVLSTGVSDAVLRMSTVDHNGDVHYEDVVDVESAKSLSRVIHDILDEFPPNTDEVDVYIPLPYYVTHDEVALIKDFIEYPRDATVSWVQARLTTPEPDALCRLLTAADHLAMPSLMETILSSCTIWTWSHIVAMLEMLAPDLLEFVMTNSDAYYHQQMEIAKQVLSFDKGVGGDVNLINEETYAQVDYNVFQSCVDVNILQYAILVGEKELVRILTRVPGIDVNVLSWRVHYTSPLMMAIERGSADVVRMLLEVPGIELNAGDEYGQTALYAVRHNRVDIAELLVQFGINVDIADGFSESPLHVAARRNSVDMAKLLVAAGIDVNVLNARTGQSPLHAAAEHNSVDVAKWLVKAGIDVTILDGSGQSPLHEAAKCKNSEDMVKYLVALDGIKVNLPDKDGNTPRVLAEIFGNDVVADYLRVVELANGPGTSTDAHDAGTADNAIQAQRHTDQRGRGFRRVLRKLTGLRLQ